MLCNLPCRIVLIVVNTVTGIIGLAIMIVGALMVWGKSVVVSILDKMISPLLSNINVSNEAPQVTDLVSRILSSTAPIGIVLFSFGAALTILAFIGYCGSCCNYKILLYVYAGIIGLVAITVIVAVIVYFSMKDKLATLAVDLFAKHVGAYSSMAVNDVNSLIVMFFQHSFECCGVDSPADFVNMSLTDEYKSQPYNNVRLPVPCCMMDKLYNLNDINCPTAPTNINSYQTTPCRGNMKVKFIYYMNFAAYGLIGTFVVLLLLFLFTLLTIRIDFI